MQSASSSARRNKPIWQDWGDSRVAPRRPALSRKRQMRAEPAADPHRLDSAGQTGHIVDRHEDAAQCRFPLGRLRLLARHLGYEAADRGLLLHPDHRIVVATHPGIANE